MSLQEQMDTRRVLRDLKTNPLNVLQANGVMVGNLTGNVTQSLRLGFGYLNNDIRIGPVAFAGNFDRNGQHTDAVIRVLGLASAMRDFGAPGRLHATNRLAAGANEIWVTEQQSGCSVLILDWGGLQYSMVHLRPNDDSEFASLSRRLMKNDTVRAGYKNLWLKQEVTTVANASMAGGARPKRYILVQSNFNTARFNEMQVIGVRAGAGWQFFQQTYQYDMWNTQYMNLTARQLEWTAWHSYVPYMAY